MFSCFGKSFKSEKCKGELRMAMSRIKVVNNARNVDLQKLKREVAALLESGQDINARVKVEHVIREENAMAAYGLISIYCESILSRLPDIKSKKICPIDLKEPISGIIFASPRCADISELSRLSKKFSEKYGKEFTISILELRPNCGVSSELVEKLSIKQPNIETKLEVLFLIASKHGINWEPKSFDEPLQNPHELMSGPTSFENAAQTSPKHELTIATSHPEEISLEINFNSDMTVIRSMEAPDQQSHPMYFKDPFHAALSAAKSAEMANMAAKAASEIAFMSVDSEQDLPRKFPEYTNQSDGLNVVSEGRNSGIGTRISSAYSTSLSTRNEEFSNGRVRRDTSDELVDEYDDHSPIERKVVNHDQRKEILRDNEAHITRNEHFTEVASSTTGELSFQDVNRCSNRDVHGSARGRDGFIGGYYFTPVYDDAYDNDNDTQSSDFFDRSCDVQKGLEDPSKHPRHCSSRTCEQSTFQSKGLHHVESNRGDAFQDSDFISPSRYDYEDGHSSTELGSKARYLQPSNFDNGKMVDREVRKESMHLSRKTFHSQGSSSGRSSTNRQLKISSNDYEDRVAVTPSFAFHNEDSELSEEEGKLGNSNFTETSEFPDKKSSLNSDKRHGKNRAMPISEENSDDESLADTKDHTNNWKNQIRVSNKHTSRGSRNSQPMQSQQGRSAGYVSSEMVSASSMRIIKEQDRLPYMDSRQRSSPRDSQEGKKHVPLPQLFYDGQIR